MTTPDRTSDADFKALPRHVAMIMDGNGRWANGRGLPRFAGHKQGAKTVDLVTTECARLGLEALTLYSFSSENWKRPAEEVELLMALCHEHLVDQRGRMVENGIRFRRLGRRDGGGRRTARRIFRGRDRGREPPTHRGDRP